MHEIACGAGAADPAADLPFQSLMFGDVKSCDFVAVSVHQADGVQLCRWQTVPARRRPDAYNAKILLQAQLLR